VACRSISPPDCSATSISTQLRGYVAVYPTEVIRHYRQFIDQRRGKRPSEEYREPTDAEWTEFRDHFSLRKVALGTCDRPYGTPCQHENACLTELILKQSLRASRAGSVTEGDGGNLLATGLRRVSSVLAR
jgi:hypothetical protein